MARLKRAVPRERRAWRPSGPRGWFVHESHCDEVESVIVSFFGEDGTGRAFNLLHLMSSAPPELVCMAYVVARIKHVADEAMQAELEHGLEVLTQHFGIEVMENALATLSQIPSLYGQAS